MRTGMTSVQWWNSIKINDKLLTDWLKSQYHGEATAAVRIRKFANEYAVNTRQKRALEVVAGQEELHAGWVEKLLKSRGIIASILDKHERYWDKTLQGITSWETGCAVAAHAEAMRLERIRVIANDLYAPNDIRKVFQQILPQEEFHETIFRKFSNPEAMATTDINHIQGLEALGLIL